MRIGELASSRWLWLVLANSLLIQGATYVVRPMVTYRLVELGADAVLVGFIGALYALAPLLLSIRLGRWVDKGFDGSALFAGAVVATIATIALIFSSEVILLGLAMPLLGVGHLLTMVGGQTMISKRSKDKNYERNFGLLTFYASLGQAVGPLVGGYLADQGVQIDTTPPMVFAAGIFTLAIVAAIPIAKKNRNIDFEQIAKIDSNSVRSLLATPKFKSALFVSGSITAVVDVMTIFLPLFGKEIGLGAFQVGVLMAVRSGAAMLIRLVLGQISSKLGPKNLINLGSTVTLLSCFAIFFIKDFWTLCVVLAIAGLAMAIGQPASMAWVSRITRPDQRGLAISVRLTSNRFGQVVVPLLAGAIAVAGVSPVFLMLAALQGASVLVTSKAMKNE